MPGSPARRCSTSSASSGSSSTDVLEKRAAGLGGPPGRRRRLDACVQVVAASACSHPDLEQIACQVFDPEDRMLLLPGRTPCHTATTPGLARCSPMASDAELAASERRACRRREASACSFCPLGWTWSFACWAACPRAVVQQRISWPCNRSRIPQKVPACTKQGPVIENSPLSRAGSQKERSYER